jgi:excisionase family DNA binding protein
MGALFTVDELAELWRIPKGTVYRLAKAGRIPSVFVGKHRRFPEELLREWTLAAATGAPAEPKAPVLEVANDPTESIAHPAGAHRLRDGGVVIGS